MSRIVTAAGGLATKRPVLMLGDFSPGDTPWIERLVENVPATATIEQAWITFKVNEADLDAAAVLQLEITPVSTAEGQIADTGADGVGLLRFTPTAAETALLTGQGLFYDIAVTLSDGKNYTVEKGRWFPWLPPLNRAEGSRGNTGLIRAISAEPVDRQPRPYENELLNDLVGGDDYELRRLVYGLAAGRTVTAATLTVVTTPTQADPGLFQLAGVIHDAGSGSPRRADVSFAFSKAQTQLAVVARGWRMRVTLDNGQIFTVLRGTIVAQGDVTDVEGTGNPVVTVEVTPDPFTVGTGSTEQLTAVAKNALGVVIPGIVFTWTSLTPGTASVDSNGLVTGLAVGAAAIRATAPNLVFGEADGTVQQEVTTVEVTPDPFTVEEGNDVQLTAVARDALGVVIPGATFTWDSDDDLIATVNASGLVSGVAEGDVIITATSDGVDGTADGTVEPGTGLTVVVEDTFTRTDNNASMGNAETGQTWSENASGVWGIASNRAAPLSGAGLMPATVDSAEPDCVITVTLAVTAAAEFSGLSFRLTDSGNFLDVALDATTIYLQKVEAGGSSTLGTGAITLADGDVIRVEITGSSIEVFHNGVSKVTATSAFNATATKHGLFTFNGTVTRFDDFTVEV